MAHVLLVLPLGLPGSGKTLFLNAVFEKLHGDRKFLQNKQVKISDSPQPLPLASVSLLSSDLTGSAGEKASSLVRKFAAETAQRIAASGGGRHVVLLDKNHGVSSIWKSREIFSGLSSLHVRTVVLNFQSANRKFVGNFPKNWPFPFPVETFATCVKRLSGRADHPTLPFSDQTAAHVISVLFAHLAAHRRAPSAFRTFRGLRGFDVLPVPAISVPQASRATLEGLAQAVQRADAAAVLAVLDKISVQPLGEDAIGNFAADFQRRVAVWAQPRRFPRYFAVDLQAEKENFFRVLLETNFIADSTRITLVPDPHVTLMYLDFARPENWEAISRAEDLHFLLGSRVNVEVRRAVFVDFGLLCFDVEISGIDESLFPIFPHVTVCYAEPFKARHSNDLLRLASSIDFTNFQGSTPNGELHSASGAFSIEGISFNRISVWTNTKKNLKLNGLVTSVY